MAIWRKSLVSAIAALSLVGMGTISAGAHEGGTLLEFDSMTPVTNGAVGTVNSRGLTGGGLPWAITSGTGEVDRRGEVEVSVTGLVIPVAPFFGTNPVPFFKAILSCITPHGVVNVSTGNFPASMAGDSTIHGFVRVPHPCKFPILFVTSPTGAWFAMSNPER